VSRSRILAIAAAVSLALASAALAHTRLSSTSPRDGAVLENPPRAALATFSTDIAGGTLVVRKAGRVVSIGQGGRNPATRKQLRVRLRSGLTAGRYVARWTVVAGDGDEQSGSFSFRVR
jgi:methionine-rich copper-binding protein CopC